MKTLDNIRISRKILLVIGMVALPALGASLYATNGLQDIEGRYSDLIETNVRAAGQISDASYALANNGRILNRLFIIDDPADLRRQREELNQARADLRAALEGAKGRMPAYATDIDRVLTDATRLGQITGRIEEALAAGDGATARRLLTQERLPLYDSLRTGFIRLADRVEGEMDRTIVEMGEVTTRIYRATLAVALLGVLLPTLFALWLTRRSLTGPIAQLTARMRGLSEGERDSPVPGAGRRDELGLMAEAVEGFRQAAIERERLQVAAEAEAAAKAARAARVEELVRGFEAGSADALRVMASAATELDATANELQTTAQAGTAGASSLAAASQQANGNVATVASSAEEMAASIAEVARQVTESAEVARRASESARQTDGAMQGLSEAASRIGDVVRLIGDIAGQTNLLALNATIEAARAGDAGKGFAVVASEVKALASQTARATEEIGQQISAMQAETGRAVEAIRGIGRTIENLDGLTTQVAAAAEEQAAATREIGRAVAEAAAGTHEVSRHAGSVTEGAQQTGAAATQVRAASGELARSTERLNAQVEDFLSSIRAA